MKLLSFLMDNREYALDITKVSEVIRVGEITTIPDAADFVKGVICLRGEVVSLISLRRKLSLPDAEIKNSDRIIVVQIEDHIIGVVVDSVRNVFDLSGVNITPPDQVLKDAGYLVGVAKVNGKLILIVDIGSLITNEEKDGIRAVHSRVEIEKSE